MRKELVIECMKTRERARMPPLRPGENSRGKIGKALGEHLSPTRLHGRHQERESSGKRRGRKNERKKTNNTGDGKKLLTTMQKGGRVSIRASSSEEILEKGGGLRREGNREHGVGEV